MISLKKYLDSASVDPGVDCELVGGSLVCAAISAYASSLLEMGSCSMDACPGLGNGLKQHLGELSRNLNSRMGCDTLRSTGREVDEELRVWGRQTARYYQQKSNEVKDLLIVMARMAESVGARDQRCAGQISEVTTRLTNIASLDDLTEIRTSIEQSAAALKTSITKMTEEGKAAIDQLREQVSTYQAKLEEAEEIASRDALTNLRSRLCVEILIERHIRAATRFCVAMVDIDHFKKVNDEYGHLTGDELLKQFATELLSACRSTDVIGRWGGDEFIIVLECGLSEAGAHIDRLSKWVCGNYSIPGKSASPKLRVDASIGLAEHVQNEEMKDLIARADAAMYVHKTAKK